MGGGGLGAVELRQSCISISFFIIGVSLFVAPQILLLYFVAGVGFEVKGGYFSGGGWGWRWGVGAWLLSCVALTSTESLG